MTDKTVPAKERAHALFRDLLQDLRLFPQDWTRAAVVTLACIVGVTLWICFVDFVLFRHHLTEHYLAFFTSPLWPRLPVTCLVAVGEETRFRLLAMTLLVAAGRLLWRRRPPDPAFLVFIVLTQLACVHAILMAEPAYTSLRYLAVGCVWGWLYWRHSWTAAVAGHSGTHLVLDPILLVGLA